MEKKVSRMLNEAKNRECAVEKKRRKILMEVKRPDQCVSVLGIFFM